MSRRKIRRGVLIEDRGLEMVVGNAERGLRYYVDVLTFDDGGASFRVGSEVHFTAVPGRQRVDWMRPADSGEDA